MAYVQGLRYIGVFGLGVLGAETYQGFFGCRVKPELQQIPIQTSCVIPSSDAGVVGNFLKAHPDLNPTQMSAAGLFAAAEDWDEDNSV